MSVSFRRAAARYATSGGGEPMYPDPAYCAACGAAPCLCPLCHGAGWLRGEYAPGGVVPPAVPCRCAARRGQLAAAAGADSVLADYPDRRFDTFEPVAGLGDALAAAESFAAAPAGWLFLAGPPGVGKTHLAAAVANAAAARGDAVAMHVMPQLLRDMRRCFAAADAGDRSGSTRFHALVDAVAAAPLLVLDDLGAEYGTKWAVEQTFLLVEERYRRRLPLVATTNAYNALEPRVRSRLDDAGLSVVVRIEAPDYRRRPVQLRALPGGRA